MLGSGGAVAGSGGATSGTLADAAPDAATQAAAQKYVFEIHRTYFGWGRVHIDDYITADGNVYRADQSDS
jgi:hypothetical protein